MRTLGGHRARLAQALSGLGLGVLVGALLLCASGTSSPIVARAIGRAHKQVVSVAGARRPTPASDPGICSGCEPPLGYRGGPVLSTTTGGGLTVTPIYWQPSGGQYAFPGTYESIINSFVANVAAASGSSNNVFSIMTEYYQSVGGKKSQLTYAIHAGTPIVDTGAFPANGCTPSSSEYTACLTDAQLRTELGRFTKQRGLPTDLAHFYPVFFPPKVETQDRDGTNSDGSYCGYHRAFGSGASMTVYGDEPYEASGCDGGQAPNGNLTADGAVSVLSHELNEAITDPEDPAYAWNDNAGNEIGDLCANNYGAALGATNPSNPSTTEYNQVINGGKYYLQEEYSNLSYTKLGVGKGCMLSEAAARQASGSGGRAATGQTTTGQTTTKQSVKAKPVTAVLDATPTALAADGKSTSEITLGLETPTGESVVGDRIHFGVGLSSGSGVCGTLSNTEQKTDANGFASVTYTASSDNVTCSIVAVEANHGQAAVTLVYQGTTQKNAQTFNAAFPASLQPGGEATTFTITATNPASRPVPATRVTLTMFPGDGTTQHIDANQVHLAYSTTGSNGSFTPVALDGSTADGGAIDGHIGPPQGIALPASSTQTYTFHVSVASNAPTSKTKPLLAFEGYLDEIDAASGSGATVGDTYAHQVKVFHEPSHTLRNVLIAVGAMLLLGLGVLGVVLWQKRRNPPQAPFTQGASP